MSGFGAASEYRGPRRLLRRRCPWTASSSRPCPHGPWRTSCFSTPNPSGAARGARAWQACLSARHTPAVDPARAPKGRAFVRDQLERAETAQKAAVSVRPTRADRPCIPGGGGGRNEEVAAPRRPAQGTLGAGHGAVAGGPPRFSVGKDGTVAERIIANKAFSALGTTLF